MPVYSQCRRSRSIVPCSGALDEPFWDGVASTFEDEILNVVRDPQHHARDGGPPPPSPCPSRKPNSNPDPSAGKQRTKGCSMSVMRGRTGDDDPNPKDTHLIRISGTHGTYGTTRRPSHWSSTASRTRADNRHGGSTNIELGTETGTPSPLPISEVRRPRGTWIMTKLWHGVEFTRVMRRAWICARRDCADKIEPAHVWMGLARTSRGTHTTLLHGLGYDVGRVRRGAPANRRRRARACSSSALPFSRSTQSVLRAAAAETSGKACVESRHLVLGLLRCAYFPGALDSTP